MYKLEKCKFLNYNMFLKFWTLERNYKFLLVIYICIIKKSLKNVVHMNVQNFKHVESLNYLWFK